MLKVINYGLAWALFVVCVCVRLDWLSFREYAKKCGLRKKLPICPGFQFMFGIYVECSVVPRDWSIDPRVNKSIYKSPPIDSQPVGIVLPSLPDHITTPDVIASAKTSWISRRNVIIFWPVSPFLQQHVQPSSLYGPSHSCLSSIAET